MLILTRRVAESIHVGEEIRVTVLGIQDNQVRLGINAPKEVPVHREEIYYRIKYENEAKNQGNESNEGNEGNQSNEDNQGNQGNQSNEDNQGNEGNEDNQGNEGNEGNDQNAGEECLDDDIGNR